LVGFLLAVKDSFRAQLFEGLLHRISGASACLGCAVNSFKLAHDRAEALFLLEESIDSSGQKLTDPGVLVDLKDFSVDGDIELRYGPFQGDIDRDLGAGSRRSSLTTSRILVSSKETGRGAPSVIP